MKEKERDIFDDLIRSKFQDFEADTNPGDWEAISERLSVTSNQPLRRRWMYRAAAAVITLLMIVSGGVYLLRNDQLNTTIAKQAEKKETPIEPQTKERPTLVTPPAKEETPLLAVAKRIVPANTTAISVNVSIPEKKEKEGVKEDVKEKTNDREVIPIRKDQPLIIDDVVPERKETQKEAPEVKTKAKSSSRWGFGMGAGGFTESSGNVVNTYVLRSNSYAEDERLLSMNALSDQAEGKEPKTNIKHRTPISFGISVSRQLNDRFSLQSGLTYSFLTSDWETQASTYNKEIRQRLHFIGIPLSLSYRIADWNRFRFYASAGAQAEINVSGQERTKTFFVDQQTGVDTKSVRMKEWQWSVNARAGVSYPLLRFVSAFAEVGATYYFDNGSSIETIYSDKPFNVSPQIGLRLNF
ncbi:opacity protein-like surface antigen [Parabacteroides sp. PF5-5]|uniref:porin family protein n=1 Tax=unclassified Parabacteroides TaxID=2649774 RepID=UPI0024769800|nr:MULTISPECIES: porin family protein [unclassified Parabacteroides]MDH6304143.1 opacity protein-like surface antigen [Parabacteroides sp. PH5-39]MDH6315157.1 opacity protein-like surface antigen [Parabacteroides sp. PF5-13]MDH6318802.1 opacity protein-like surface antigen [Parabacteroides sp. PH5-13]MDH6322531.1 opacity protein-like surface antigen [Parabacteroides sp. PH5-8]MDH6326317.1 opacity protein-like surface antigen [Parabacteroides sp. PH5-41]